MIKSVVETENEMDIFRPERITGRKICKNSVKFEVKWYSQKQIITTWEDFNSFKTAENLLNLKEEYEKLENRLYRYKIFEYKDNNFICDESMEQEIIDKNDNLKLFHHLKEFETSPLQEKFEFFRTFETEEKIKRRGRGKKSFLEDMNKKASSKKKLKKNIQKLSKIKNNKEKKKETFKYKQKNKNKKRSNRKKKINLNKKKLIKAKKDIKVLLKISKTDQILDWTFLN